jgi:hypothetical protein
MNKEYRRHIMNRFPSLGSHGSRRPLKGFLLALALAMAVPVLVPTQVLAQERARANRNVVVTPIPLKASAQTIPGQAEVLKVPMQQEEVRPGAETNPRITKPGVASISVRAKTKVFLAGVTKKGSSRAEEPGTIRKAVGRTGGPTPPSVP